MAQPSYRLVKTRLTGMSAKCFLEVRPLSHDAGYMLAINVKFAPIGHLPPWWLAERMPEITERTWCRSLLVPPGCVLDAGEVLGGRGTPRPFG